MKVLSNKYSKTLKTLSVDFDWLKIEELKTCFDCISRFENLTELRIKIQEFKGKDPIDDCLSLIGQKCTKLLKLELLFYYSVQISKRFFNVFTQFIALKRLKMMLLAKKQYWKEVSSVSNTANNSKNSTLIILIWQKHSSQMSPFLFQNYNYFESKAKEYFRIHSSIGFTHWKA